MAAASYSSDVLEAFYGPIPRRENRNLPEPQNPRLAVWYDGFQISQNNFQDWLRVWRMAVSETMDTSSGLQEKTKKSSLIWLNKKS